MPVIATDASAASSTTTSVSHHVKVHKKQQTKAPKRNIVSKVLNRGFFNHLFQRGEASWYGNEFQGAQTASGIRFDTNQPMCAHRTLPFGTKVLVENVQTGLKAVCTIRDRGPFVAGRILDMSHALKQAIGMVGGTTIVAITIVH
jgi:rare lipoprotein A (peptidoglycan hydrolase)